MAAGWRQLWHSGSIWQQFLTVMLGEHGTDGGDSSVNVGNVDDYGKFGQGDGGLDLALVQLVVDVNILCGGCGDQKKKRASGNYSVPKY